MYCSITVKGHLDQRWSQWFDALTIIHLEDGESVLTGRLPDQAALHGVLTKVRDLALTLVEVQCNDRCPWPNDTSFEEGSAARRQQLRVATSSPAERRVKGDRGMIARRTLGTRGPSVSAIGFGAMVIAPGVYDTPNDEESLATLHRALELGMNFIDTADIYGNGHSERLVGRATAGQRGEVVLATKFGGGGRDRLGRPE